MQSTIKFILATLLTSLLAFSAQAGDHKGFLTTHILDTMNGAPGANVAIQLYRVSEDGKRELIKEVTTNSDGRTDERLLDGEDFKMGQYELVFAIGDYFAARGVDLPSPRFLDKVTIAFGIFDDTHYHVPLLASPWTYTTYRGS